MGENKTGVFTVAHAVSCSQIALPNYKQFVESSLQARLMDMLCATLNDGRHYAIRLMQTHQGPGTELLPVIFGRHAIVSLVNPMDAEIGEYAATTYGIDGRTGRLYRRVELETNGERVELWQRVE